MGLIIIIGVVLVFAYCWFRISQRLGYDGFLGLLMVIPIVNLVIIIVWALCESPNEQKIASLQRKLAHPKPINEVADADVAQALEQLTQEDDD